MPTSGWDEDTRSLGCCERETGWVSRGLGSGQCCCSVVNRWAEEFLTVKWREHHLLLLRQAGLFLLGRAERWLHELGGSWLTHWLLTATASELLTPSSSLESPFRVTKIVSTQWVHINFKKTCDLLLCAEHHTRHTNTERRKSLPKRQMKVGERRMRVQKGY